MSPARGRGRLGAACVILPLLVLALTPAGHFGVTAHAQATVPTLWGIDTTDNVQQDNDLSNTQAALGALPQCVGRYLVWDSELSSAEALYARTSGVAILLIDSPDQDFNNASGDAQQAIAQAESLDVPSGTAIFRDVEAGSPITTSYITGYYDAFQGSGYIPGFYENPGTGLFNSAYCAAVTADPTIGEMPLYSSEPELESYVPNASQAPAWTPETPSCANTTVAWQYLEQGVNSASWPLNSPNVDVDEFDAAYGDLLWGFGDPDAESTTDWPLGMMRGTSPSIAALSGGGYEAALQANSTALWTVGDDGTKDWQVGMMSGTSPSITELAGGGFEVAFQANTGDLWTVGTAGTVNWQMGMMSGTSPSITGLSGGGYEVAFQENTGALGTVGTAGSTGWQIGMMSGTSPSIAGLVGGGYEVACQADPTDLWTVGTAGTTDWQVEKVSGTSPSIAALATGGYEVAIQASTVLWAVGMAGDAG
jgi:hypothetical protein